MLSWLQANLPFFESVVGGEQVSRYSFVGSSPYKTISCGHEMTTIANEKGETKTTPTPADPLQLIEDELLKSAITDLKNIDFQEEPLVS